MIQVICHQSKLLYSDMKSTYFLSNRKEKNGKQLARQIQMFLQRKKIALNSDILIEVSDAMKSQTKFNTVKITIS
jgi:hypothetical protein